MATYDFDTDFSLLGKLPDAYEAGRLRTARREALAGLDSSNIGSLESAAARLAKAGDIDNAMKFYTAAATRRELARKSLVDTQSLLAQQLILKSLGDKGGAPSGGTAAQDIFPVTPGGIETTPRPAGPDFGPVPQGPSTTVPPGLPVPGPQSSLAPPAGPLDESQVAPFQVAQAGGAVPFPKAPPGPPAVPGMEITQGLGVLGGQASAELPRAPQNPKLNTQQQGVEDAKFYARILATPGRYPPHQMQGIKALMGEALDRAKVPQIEKDWHQFNADQAIRGQPRVDFSRYKADTEGRKTMFDAAHKQVVEYVEEGKKANQLGGIVDRLEIMAKDPRFTSGPGTELFSKAQLFVRSTADLLEKQLGIKLPQGWKESIDNATSGAVLRENFAALAGGSVFEKLGTVGNNVSNTDLTFVRAMFPGLNMTVEGNQMMIEYFKEVVKRNQSLAKDAAGLVKSKGGQLDIADVHEATQGYWDRDANSLLRNSKGELTDLGRRMQNESLKNMENPPRSAAAPTAPSGRAKLPPLDYRQSIEPRLDRYLEQLLTPGQGPPRGAPGQGMGGSRSYQEPAPEAPPASVAPPGPLRSSTGPGRLLERGIRRITAPYRFEPTTGQLIPNTGYLEEE